jgi:predicted Kef-type K+ transport protein
VLLLLFSVGLKLRFKSLLRLEVLIGSLLHLALSAALFLLLLAAVAEISRTGAWVLAVALSFSSTVIAAKILETKRELRAFHGRTAIGILIIQDLVAIAILGFAGQSELSPWALALLGLLVLKPLLHKLLDLTGHDELLLLLGLIMALVIGASSFEQVGFSPELGALLLGVLFSTHARASELSNALWGLKEIMLIGFFLQIGLAGQPTPDMFYVALLLTLLLPIKAALFFLVLLLFRLRARSSFLAAISLATYSEFGLIVVAYGVKQGWMGADWMVLFALTVALSFIVTAPIDRQGHQLYLLLKNRLEMFQSRKRHPDDEPISLGNSHILIMGMGRVGSGAYDTLTQLGHRVIGLDSDPGKVERHRQKGRRVLYADAEDPGLWQNIELEGIHSILLAMPDMEAKVSATRQLRATGFSGVICATATYPEELEQIKAAGADLAYNYYDNIGSGIAAQLQELLTKPAPG